MKSLESPECLNCSDPHCKNESHSEERDGHMLDIMGALIECSHEFIPMGGGKGDKEYRQVIPGWKEMVEPHREKAVLWHSIWQSCGRSNREHHGINEEPISLCSKEVQEAYWSY